ncbi:MAG: indolepyruvate ferredoxin oxidoreductase subunit alpha [Acidimicrobiales bacterium]
MNAYTVAIDDRCTACGACLVTCPERALLAAPRRPRSVDARCTGCLACIEICPRDAIAVDAASPAPTGELGSLSRRRGMPTEPGSGVGW